MNQRVALGSNRCSAQPQSRLSRRSPSLSNVTTVARADDVFPGRCTALRSRFHMVERKFQRRKPPKAILTGVAVPGENIAAIELDSLPRDFRKAQHPDDPRNEKAVTNRSNPVVLGVAIPVSQPAVLCPAVEVVGLVATVSYVNDFGNGSQAVISFEQERKRTANADNTQRGEMRVEEQDVTV